MCACLSAWLLGMSIPCKLRHSLWYVYICNACCTACNAVQPANIIYYVPERLVTSSFSDQTQIRLCIHPNLGPCKYWVIQGITLHMYHQLSLDLWNARSKSCNMTVQLSYICVHCEYHFKLDGLTTRCVFCSLSWFWALNLMPCWHFFFFF